jgi:nucleoside-diphosphate-sugar epimerase
MRLLATGGCGFLVSTIARHLLDTEPTASVIVLDASPADDLISRTFEPYAERVTFERGSVTSHEALERLDLTGITHVIHGAAVTKYPNAELDAPERFIDVNVTGTINVLRRAAAEPTLQRFVNLSSGAVYGDPTDQSPETPQPEEGPFNPSDLYAISKYSGERAAFRCATLLDVDVRAARLSDVFGPMERPTSVRSWMSLPYRMVAAVLASRPLTVTPQSLDGGGDYISVEDVADAISRLIRSTSLRHDVYNIAYGTFTTVASLFATFQQVAPEFRWETDDDADVAINPANRRGRWNAYATTRIRDDVGWRPRPLAAQLDTYLHWAIDQPA